MVVDDELEAATRFNGSEEDDNEADEEDKSRNDPTHSKLKVLG